MATPAVSVVSVSLGGGLFSSVVFGASTVMVVVVGVPSVSLTGVNDAVNVSGLVAGVGVSLTGVGSVVAVSTEAVGVASVGLLAS